MEQSLLPLFSALAAAVFTLAGVLITQRLSTRNTR
jgi:hypothetical protein